MGPRRLVLTLISSCLFIPGMSQAQQDFSIVVLPDTQYYAASYPQIFNQQTQWIVDHQAEYNIQLVIGVGDVVDDPMQEYQLQNADAAIRALEGKVPYALAIGNHDYDYLVPQLRQASRFNAYFGPSRYV